MDSGDIIYLIIAVFFMILGFFNKSKEKKKNTANKPAENASPLFPPIPPITVTKKNREEENRHATPPLPPKPVFQSSLDLVTDFEGESSLKGVRFDKGVDFSYEEKPDSQTVIYHNAIADLVQENAHGELRKALIYKEVLQQKF